MLILKAVSKRHDKDFEFPCDGPHNTTEAATWDIDLALVGKLRLCTPHYRELTQWECGNDRKCNHINYGMAPRCGVCGWVRPDTCGKCGEWSTVPLIKITEERAPHDCHTCNGDAKERQFVRCGACNGNTVVAEHGCVTCYGTGRMMEHNQMCPGCNGSGQSRSICKACKGVGEVMGWSNADCTTCRGTGICRASSANWGIGRIPLTDISPGHRDTLKPYVGRYLCFRCSNPDFQFTPYRADRTPLQCSHVEEKPEGLARCTNDVARNNPSKFCFAHSNSNRCSVCGKRLELDESGGRCRNHAKCGVCNDAPVKGSLFCPSHQEYRALGRMFEKQTSPESPPQILKAQEEVAKSRKKLEHRCNESLDRSKELSGEIIKLEQTQHGIIANDPQINQWRRDEIMKIEVEIAGLDKTPEGKEKEAKLRKEVAQLEEEINGGREDRESILIGKLSVKIEDIRREMEKALADYVRCQHIDKELQALSERLHDLRRYELWERDKGRTPEYVGTPLMIPCKKCAVPFNVRTPNKWLCPNCTTVSHIETRPVWIKEVRREENRHKSPGKWLEEMRALENKLDGRKPKRKRRYKLNENDRTHREAMEDFRVFLDVESTEKAVSKLLSKNAGEANAVVSAYQASLIERKLAPATVDAYLAAVRSTLIKPKWEVAEPAFVASILLPTDNTPKIGLEEKILCEICREEVKEVREARNDDGNKLFLPNRYGRSDNDVEVIPQSYLGCPKCMFWESGPGNVLREKRRRAIEADLIKKETEKTRLDYYFSDLAKSILGKRKARIIVSNNMRERPKPFPLPPMESVADITEARKAAAKKELADQTVVALGKFRALIAKDEITIEELIELGRLRCFLRQTYKEDELPKKVVESGVIVPPSPPSQWLR